MKNGGRGGHTRRQTNQMDALANAPKARIDTSTEFSTKANRDGDALEPLSVYVGRDCLGSIFDLGCKVAASLEDGRDLGTFPSIEAARQAILAARPR